MLLAPVPSEREQKEATTEEDAHPCPEQVRLQRIVRQTLEGGSRPRPHVIEACIYFCTRLFFVERDIPDRRALQEDMLELLKMGCPGFLASSEGRTMLNMAIRTGDVGIVAYMLDMGFSASDHGHSSPDPPLDTALECGHMEIASIIGERLGLHLPPHESGWNA